jgi:hypothetical protein
MNCYIEATNVDVIVSAGPYIAKLSPNPTEPGAKMTLQGAAFGSEQGESKVYLDDVEVSQILSWRKTQIEFTLPEDADSGKVKVVVDERESNGVQLEVEILEPDPHSFYFVKDWSIRASFAFSGWPEPDTMDFTATFNGRVLNAINPVIEVRDYAGSDDAKAVKFSNMKRSEVVTVEGTVNMDLSRDTVYATFPRTDGTYGRIISRYFNPRVILKSQAGDLLEAFPDLNFSWIFDAISWPESMQRVALYVVYDVEKEYYKSETAAGPFTPDDAYPQDGFPANTTDEVFRLDVDVEKTVPEYATP